VVRSKNGILLSQRKYLLNLLSETGMLGCMSINSPMDVNTKLLLDQGELLDDAYKRLVDPFHTHTRAHTLKIHMYSCG